MLTLSDSDANWPPAAHDCFAQLAVFDLQSKEDYEGNPGTISVPPDPEELYEIVYKEVG